MSKLLSSILVFLLVSTSWAAVITIELGSVEDINPDPYVVEVQQLEITEHSAIDIYVENMENQFRYKDWELVVYVPTGYSVGQLTLLDYETANPPQYYEDGPIPMLLDQGAVPIPGYDAFHIDTKEAGWYQYGTQPKGADWGRVDIGNPLWVSYHFEVDDTITDSIFVSIYDECIPEPATICLFGLGALALIRKRRL